eukprot:Skav201629  [mRNA]  locus=scaffold3582:93477:98835:- [translate_table: standard]
MWFAESLQKTQKRPVKMEQVKAVQSTVKAAFRQLPKAWQAVKGSKEARPVGSAGSLQAASRLAAATLSKAEAESQVEAQQNERLDADPLGAPGVAAHQQVEAEESHASEERSAREPGTLEHSEPVARAMEGAPGPAGKGQGFQPHILQVPPAVNLYVALPEPRPFQASQSVLKEALKADLQRPPIQRIRRPQGRSRGSTCSRIQA